MLWICCRSCEGQRSIFVQQSPALATPDDGVNRYTGVELLGVRVEVDRLGLGLGLGVADG